jgi:hypothetical protein
LRLAIFRQHPLETHVQGISHIRPLSRLDNSIRGRIMALVTDVRILWRSLSPFHLTIITKRSPINALTRKMSAESSLDCC